MNEPLFENPRPGNTWYDVVDNRLFMYDGQRWVIIGDSSHVHPILPYTIEEQSLD